MLILEKFVLIDTIGFQINGKEVKKIFKEAKSNSEGS